MTVYYNHIVKNITCVLFLGLALYTPLCANNIDSLLEILDHTEEPEERWEIYQALGKQYFQEHPNTDSSSFYFRKAIQIAADNQFVKKQAKSYVELGKLLFETRTPNQQLIQLIDTAIVANRACEDCPKGLMRLITMKGIVCQNMGLQEEALALFNECLEYAQEQKDAYQLVALYNSIAGCFDEVEETEKSLQYYQQGLAIVDTMDWPLGRSVLLNNIADLYVVQKKYTEAEDYFKQSIAIKRQLENDAKLSVGLCQIALLYLETNRWERAINNAQEGLALARKSKNNNGTTICLNCLAQIAKIRKEYNLEIAYAREGLAIQADNADLFEFNLNYYEHLYTAFQQKQEYDSAFHYLQLFQTLSDTLQKNQNAREIEELAIGFNLQEANFANELLQEKQQKSELLLQKRSTAIYLVIFVALALLAGVFLWSRKKEKLYRKLDRLVQDKTASLQEAVKELEGANEELSYFTYITSHDLKEPLRNINGFAALLNRKLKGIGQPEISELLLNIKRSTTQMDALIEDVMQYALVNEKAVNNEEFHLKELIGLVQEDLGQLLTQKNGHILCQEDLLLNTSKTAFRLVFNNLFKNGIQYNTSSQPIVWVNTEISDSELIIHVKDNGIGIDPAFQEQVFDMFKRLHSRAEYQGTGLGLAITKRMLNKINGSIKLKSEKGVGSTFSLYLPLKVWVTPQ